MLYISVVHSVDYVTLRIFKISRTPLISILFMCGFFEAEVELRALLMRHASRFLCAFSLDSDFYFITFYDSRGQQRQEQQLQQGEEPGGSVPRCAERFAVLDSSAVLVFEDPKKSCITPTKTTTVEGLKEGSNHTICSKNASSSKEIENDGIALSRLEALLSSSAATSIIFQDHPQNSSKGGNTNSSGLPTPAEVVVDQVELPVLQTLKTVKQSPSYQANFSKRVYENVGEDSDSSDIGEDPTVNPERHLSLAFSTPKRVTNDPNLSGSSQRTDCEQTNQRERSVLGFLSKRKYSHVENLDGSSSDSKDFALVNQNNSQSDEVKSVEKKVCGRRVPEVSLKYRSSIRIMVRPENLLHLQQNQHLHHSPGTLKISTGPYPEIIWNTTLSNAWGLDLPFRRI